MLSGQVCVPPPCVDANVVQCPLWAKAGDCECVRAVVLLCLAQHDKT
jgi:hypothetical protein